VELAPDTGTDLFQRFILAYLTGNGDLHLENLSLLGGKNGCRLAPVYDPAPMRAWARHDLVSAIGYDAQSYPDEASVFMELGGTLGLSRAEIDAVVEQALETTRDYAERVADCAVINDGQRQRLVTIAKATRAALKSSPS
ncbi:HipA domain-containing protein, partial [Thiolapillus sp.]